MRNYQCRKCGTLVAKDGHPNSEGCPTDNWHSWCELGDVGQNTFQCRICGTVINSKYTPPNSGDGFNFCGNAHSWVQL